VIVGESEQEARNLIREAIELHIQYLRNRGAPVPPPASASDYVDAMSA